MSFGAGSEWGRWDVHIHTPSTALNNQFGTDAWDEYVARLRSATPPAIGLGITDYLSIDGYVELRQRWVAGELPNVKLLFPNVEFRLTVNTERARGINLHLLFSPDEEDHERRIREKLALLTFTADGNRYSCSRPDLIRLGAAHDASLTSERARLEEGTKQFKVEFSELRDWYRGDKWLQRNCLVAIAGGPNDGTSGVQHDDAFASMRREIQRFAHIIFSGNPGGPR